MVWLTARSPVGTSARSWSITEKAQLENRQPSGVALGCHKEHEGKPMFSRETSSAFLVQIPVHLTHTSDLPSLATLAKEEKLLERETSRPGQRTPDLHVSYSAFGGQPLHIAHPRDDIYPLWRPWKKMVKWLPTL